MVKQDVLLGFEHIFPEHASHGYNEDLGRNRSCADLPAGGSFLDLQNRLSTGRL